MTRATLGPVLLWGLLATVLAANPALAEEPPRPPPDVGVVVEGDVDSSEAADLGRYTVHLAFLPLEDIDEAFGVELRLIEGGRILLKLDHVPVPPTTRWKKDQRVEYDLPFPLPLEAGLETGDTLELLLAFHHPPSKRTAPARMTGTVSGGYVRLARVLVPELGPTDEPALARQILDRADALAEEGQRPAAWRLLEMGLRRAQEDDTKYGFRDALLGLGHFAPEPPSLLEQQIVKRRIAQERRRYLRRMSGRYFDRGHLYAALRILEIVGGSLSEEAGEAVIGALAEAKRTQKDIQQIEVRLLARITDEEKAEARGAVEELGPTRGLLDKALIWVEAKRYPVARYALRELSLVSDRDLATEARRRLTDMEAAWLADTPDEDTKLVEQAANHPAFDRLATVATHKFIYIGPKVLVKGIPERSRLRFDLAYVFQTDLFGRVPSPKGDRVTVFFKELWSFGGGQAGGNKIDIGRADPERKGYRVDTGLLYHELTHCVDDTLPIFVGHREGLANLGAAYTFEALDQKGDSLHAFDRNLEAFRKDYLARDLAYWRIPSYGPSAGFFLHFVEAHSKRGRAHDWKPYRQFFREYRTSPLQDGREPYVARALAWYLMRAFGPGAFDDLLRFRLPLVESDREAVELEVEAFARGAHYVALRREEFEAYPNSPLPRDLRTRDMARLLGGNEDEEVERISRESLGILHEWWVIGPFKSPGADPRAHVFPPEWEIDFNMQYTSGLNSCKWRKAGDPGPVDIDAKGWVSIGFSYMEDTATYGLAHVNVKQAVEAHVHVRVDDDFTLFVNDRRVDGYVARGPNARGGTWWRGPQVIVPDAMRLPVRLDAGRNKLLLKVKNRRGTAGFILALSLPDGSPIPGLVVEAEPPEPSRVVHDLPKSAAWKTVVKHSFRTKAFSSKLDTAVGKFKVVGKRLVGQATDKQVAWRKYTVRPDFPKDSPSNLFWLKEKHTKELSAFRLALDIEADAKRGAPKLVVTFQGEGENDALSGWNLILHARGKGRVGARLERYDVLNYQTVALEMPKGEELKLVLTYVGGRLSVWLADVVILDGVWIDAIPNRHRIGVATWGAKPRIIGFKLEKKIR